MRDPLKRDWTTAEDELLRSMAKAGKVLPAIAARLKRTIRSTTVRARKIGVEVESVAKMRRRVKLAQPEHSA